VIGAPFAIALNAAGEKPTVSVLPTGADGLTLQRNTRSAPPPGCTTIGASSVNVFEPVIAETAFPPVVRTVPDEDVSRQLESEFRFAPLEAETETGTDETVISWFECVVSSVMMPMMALLRPAGTCFTKSASAARDAPETEEPTVLVDVVMNWKTLPDGVAAETSHRICSVTGVPAETVSAGESGKLLEPDTMFAAGPSAAVVDAPLVLKSEQFERLPASPAPEMLSVDGIEFTVKEPPGLVRVIVPKGTLVPGVTLVVTGVDVIDNEEELVLVLCANALPANSTDARAEIKTIFFLISFN